MKNNIKKELMEFPRKRRAWKGGVYWKDVLHEIYISHPHGYGAGKGGWTDDHPLAEKLNITGQELMYAYSFLRDHDLIDYSDSAKNFFCLSKKGFDVALQNEKIKTEQKLQKTILFFTGVIAISTLYSFFSSLGFYNTLLEQYILSGIVVLIIVIMAIKLFSTANKKY